MKFIKLIITVLVLAGIVYAIFSLTGGEDRSIRINPDSPHLLDDLKKNVDNAWDNATSWNEKAYDQTLDELAAYKPDLESHSAGSYRSLLTYTNEKVCNHLAGWIDEEFSKRDCKPASIARLKQGLDYFVATNGTIGNKDPRVAERYAQISLYEQILEFGRNNFILSPGFNVNSGSWNDFSEFSGKQKERRDRFMKHPSFKKISKVTDVSRSINSVDARLNESKRRFQQDLSSAIISAYSDMPRTQDNLEGLNRVYNRYYGANYDDNQRLSKFIDRFRTETKTQPQKRIKNYDIEESTRI